MVQARNAIAEAEAALGTGLGGRVLEPSPPAVDDGEYYADDPVATEIAADRVVSPVGGDVSWAEVVDERPDLAAWAAERWLAGPRRLPPLPDGLVEVRTGLHRLATYVIAPARHRVTGKFGLRWTKGGFGTPFFGDDVQVRVEGDQLVVQEGRAARATTITTLAAAAEFIGSAIDAETAAEDDSPPLGDIDSDLGIRAEVTEFLSAWWGTATAALETVRADPATVDPSRVQIWPGHFDAALETGDEDHRASYGASPGDHGSTEPYLYVSVWWPDRLDLDDDDPIWNADRYTGAIRGYADIAAADDPVIAAVEFFTSVRDRLAAA